MTHIDDWIYENKNNQDPDITYAVAFLWITRLNAVSRNIIRPVTESLKLFCTYKDGKRYKVTGASRLGDVWLHTDFNADHGYTNRVDITDCTNWSKEL